MQIVTAEGQIKKGDKLRIVGKNTKDDQVTFVDDVIDNNGSEEVILCQKNNYYFITKMLIDGLSWAKQVCIMPIEEEDEIRRHPENDDDEFVSAMPEKVYSQIDGEQMAERIKHLEVALQAYAKYAIKEAMERDIRLLNT